MFDNHLSAVNSEICWSRRFASPEEKIRNGRIDKEQVDEQLVWQVGMLGLYMILGESFDYEKIYEDEDIDWEYVRTKCSESLFQMLKGSLTV